GVRAALPVSAPGSGRERESAGRHALPARRERGARGEVNRGWVAQRGIDGIETSVADPDHSPKADDSTDQLIERFADDDPFSADEEERRVWSRFRPTDVVRVDGDDVVVQPGELEHGLVRPFSNLRARSRAVMARAVKRASHHG